MGANRRRPFSRRVSRRWQKSRYTGAEIAGFVFMVLGGLLLLVTLVGFISLM